MTKSKRLLLQMYDYQRLIKPTGVVHLIKYALGVRVRLLQPAQKGCLKKRKYCLNALRSLYGWGRDEKQVSFKKIRKFPYKNFIDLLRNCCEKEGQRYQPLKKE